MADTIEYYISNFEGSKIDEILSYAQMIYDIIYGQKPQEGTAVFTASDGEDPAWLVIPSIEEVKI